MLFSKYKKCHMFHSCETTVVYLIVFKFSLLLFHSFCSFHSLWLAGVDMGLGWPCSKTKPRVFIFHIMGNIAYFGGQVQFSYYHLLHILRLIT